MGSEDYALPVANALGASQIGRVGFPTRHKQIIAEVIFLHITMGTVLAIVGGYYILNGQAFKAAGEIAKWIDEKVNQPKGKNSKD